MSGIKNGTEVTLNLSSNAIGNSNDETNFLHSLLLNNTQVSRLLKAFVNNSSGNIKLSRTQLHKIGQSVGFLGRILGPLLKIALPLTKNVVKVVVKSVLIPLRLKAAASATDAKKEKKISQKKMFGSGMTPLPTSNEEMDDIMKIIKTLQESGLLTKGVSKTIKDEAKE